MTSEEAGQAHPPQRMPAADSSESPRRWPVGTRAWLGRHRHVEHYLRRLDHLGVPLGLLAFVCSLTPSLLPRSWYLQGVVSGLSVGAAYGFGVVCTWLGRRAGSAPADYFDPYNVSIHGITAAQVVDAPR